MPFLKITSDKGELVTYVNIDRCFTIKAEMRDNQAKLVFISDSGKVESYDFYKQKELKDYLRFLEKSKIFVMVDDENPTPEQKEDVLDSDYDPMEAIK